MSVHSVSRDRDRDQKRAERCRIVQVNLRAGWKLVVKLMVHEFCTGARGSPIAVVDVVEKRVGE